MKRFEHLEFGNKKSQPGKISRGEPIRDAGYFYKQAITHWLAAEFEEALRNFSRALEKNNTFFEAWRGQIHMLIELGEYPEAEIWAQKALKMFPEHPELLAAMAVANIRNAITDKAQAYSDNAMSQDNITAWVWLSRAEVMLARKSRMSENCISNAIGQAGKEGPIIQLEASRLLLKYNSHIPALEYAGFATKQMPKSALAWYTLGCCQAKLGFSDASLSLQRCLDLRPKWKLGEATLAKVEKRGFLKNLFARLFRR